MTRQPFVSIIVPALNEEKCIGQCLSALNAIEYPEDRREIIVLDNGSTDRTVAIALELGASVKVAPGVTISTLRNLGVKRAKGDVVAFVDADCVVSPAWLRAALPHLENLQVGAVGSRYQHPQNPHWIERAWYSQIRDLNYYGPVRWLSGGNIVMSKSCFEKVGGFDEGLRTNEDVDLCDRIRRTGFQIISDPKVKVVHLGNPKTLLGFFRREIWYSKDVFRKFLANFPSRQNIKVIGLGAAYGMSMLLLLLWLIAGIVGYGFLTIGYCLAATMAALPIGMAVKQALKHDNWTQLPQLSLLYFVYGVARGVVFLNPRSWMAT